MTVPVATCITGDHSTVNRLYNCDLANMWATVRVNMRAWLRAGVWAGVWAGSGTKPARTPGNLRGVTVPGKGALEASLPCTNECAMMFPATKKGDRLTITLGI